MSEPDPHDELPLEVVDAMRRGRKLDAIKLLREREGMSLADAKGRVDLYMQHHHSELALFAPPESSSGSWIITVLVLAAIVYAMYTYFE